MKELTIVSHGQYLEIIVPLLDIVLDWLTECRSGLDRSTS
jgi:hypothetical protein